MLRDEREEGERALLNLGHTFGHALERVTGYDPARLVHGEAVAIGLALAFRFSVRLGLCAGQDAGRVSAHLRSVGLPTALGDVPGGSGDADALLDAMAQDKKVKDGALTFILARGIGAKLRRARRRGGGGAGVPGGRAGRLSGAGLAPAALRSPAGGPI